MSFVAQITADITGWEESLNKAGSKLRQFENDVKKSAESISRIGDTLTKVGTKASLLSAGLVAVGTKAFSMASDIEDAVGATEQVFSESSDAVKDWANSLGTQYGVAKKEALEYANLMGTMLKNIGNLTEEQASRQAATLVELAGDLTAMFGGRTQEAVNALRLL